MLFFDSLQINWITQLAQKCILEEEGSSHEMTKASYRVRHIPRDTSHKSGIGDSYLSKILGTFRDLMKCSGP